ncbi:MAG: monoheme cytochrome C [Bacteroidota bacterium]
MPNSRKNYGKWARKLYRAVIVICVLCIIAGIVLLYRFGDEKGEYGLKDLDGIEKKGDRRTIVSDSLNGFVDAPGMQETTVHCTTCHSARLVTQNRMTREGWLATIRWMQETQNLWDLGDQEPIILDYLSTYYAPEEKGRRGPLKSIEWYSLSE